MNNVCPNCGYCPTCGRRNSYPYYPYYPNSYPWYQTPWVSGQQVGGAVPQSTTGSNSL